VLSNSLGLDLFFLNIKKKTFPFFDTLVKPR